MPDEQGFKPTTAVLTVVIDLLLVALPPELKRMAVPLARQVLARHNVAPHAGKRWGDLSDAEANAVARECGLVARDVMTQAAARDRRRTSEPTSSRRAKSRKV
jgi:hypothetical protein